MPGVPSKVRKISWRKFQEMQPALRMTGLSAMSRLKWMQEWTHQYFFSVLALSHLFIYRVSYLYIYFNQITFFWVLVLKCIIGRVKEGMSFFFLYIYIFWPCRAACGILVPRPGIEPMPRALGVQRKSTGPPGKSLYFTFFNPLHEAIQSPTLALNCNNTKIVKKPVH